MKKNSKSKNKKITLNDNVGVCPQLTVLSNKEAVLEGCKKIEEYGDEKIKFSLGSITVSFCGNNMMIKNFGNDNAIICGEFSEISFG